MNSNQEIVSLANQATIALVNRNYNGALKAYGDALKVAKELGQSCLVAVILGV